VHNGWGRREREEAYLKRVQEDGVRQGQSGSLRKHKGADSAVGLTTAAKSPHDPLDVDGVGLTREGGARQERGRYAPGGRRGGPRTDAPYNKREAQSDWYMVRQRRGVVIPSLSERRRAHARAEWHGTQGGQLTITEGSGEEKVRPKYLKTWTTGEEHRHRGGQGRG